MGERATPEQVAWRQSLREAMSRPVADAVTAAADLDLIARARELADDDMADGGYDDALGRAQSLISELLAIIARTAIADSGRCAAPAGISPGMQKWLQREAHMCGMSADAIIAAALAEYRARRTPEDRLRFRDGTPNYHHRNVEFMEDDDAGR